MKQNTSILKKILLFLGILILSIFSVQAVQYLNSCGKNSEWIDGETYILNFSYADRDIVGTDNCFYLMDNSAQNLIFSTNNNELILNNLRLLYINYQFVTTPIIIYNSNIKLKGLNRNFEGQLVQLIGTSYICGGTFDTKLKIKNTNISVEDTTYSTNLIDLYILAPDTSCGGSCTSIATIWNYNNITIENSFIKSFKPITKVKSLAYYWSPICGDLLYSSRVELKINSSVILNLNSGLVEGIGNQPQDPSVATTYIQNSVLGNSFLNNANINIYSGNTSLISKLLFNSTNNNLVSGNYNLQNMFTYLDLFNYRFLQDYTEGQPHTSVFGKESLVFINNGDVGSPTTITLGSPLDSSLINTIMINAESFRLSEGSKINCNLFTNYKCNISNQANSTISLSQYYLNYISVGNYNLIEGVNFNISHDNYSGAVTTSIIGNKIENQLNNLQIIKNNFFSTGNILVDFNETLSRPFLKLNYINLNISNNNFSYFFSSNIGVGEFFNIKSTNTNSNKIFLNTFENKVNAPLTKTEIGNYNLKTQFYNNYVGQNVIISSKNNTGINATPYVAYKYTDGNYYYYYVGNYYIENVGCIDNNSDGFCDSPYTSGNVTDTHPLVSYPFDFTQHLLTRDKMVIPNDYNITIHDLLINQNIDLYDGTEGINFKFSQNSDYDDLVCDYIIDSLSVYTKVNPIKNIIYNYTKMGGWTSGIHTFSVECYNEIQGYKTTLDYWLDINLTGQIENGENGGGGSETGLNLIDTTSTQNTVDNVIGYAGAVSNAFVEFFSPIAIFMVVIIGILAIAVFLGA